MPKLLDDIVAEKGNDIAVADEFGSNARNMATGNSWEMQEKKLLAVYGNALKVA